MKRLSRESPKGGGSKECGIEFFYSLPFFIIETTAFGREVFILSRSTEVCRKKIGENEWKRRFDFLQSSLMKTWFDAHSSMECKGEQKDAFLASQKVRIFKLYWLPCKSLFPSFDVSKQYFGACCAYWGGSEEEEEKEKPSDWKERVGGKEERDRQSWRGGSGKKFCAFSNQVRERSHYVK